MSITITVRPNGATSGGTNQDIPGDGEIDTKEEAEAALTFLPDGSTDTVVMGNRTYTRAQLIEIRDRSAAPAAAAAAATVPGPGVSHGAVIDGYYSGGLGSLGHSGGGVRAGYIPGITLADGDHRLFLDPGLGLDVGHFSKDFSTPGGEQANSAFTRYGGYLGGAVRYAPPILDHRLWASLGVRLGFGGFSTADSTTVSTPTGCTPGDFGRNECEPGAGPQKGNAGTTGLFDPRTGGSVGTSGAYFNFGIPLTIGGDVVRGTWGNAQIFAGVEPNYTRLFPSGSQAFDYWSVSGLLGIRANFGGGAVEGAAVAPAAAPAGGDKDGDGVLDKDDKCPDVKGPKENGGCPAYDASVTSSPAAVKAQEKFLVGVKVGSASKVRVAFKDQAGTVNNSNSVLVDEGNSKSEFGVPADLKSGKYKLVIMFEDMTTHVKKVEEKDITIVENVTGDMPATFPPNQKPFIKDLKVSGMEKLEGVTFEIVGTENKDGKSVGVVNSTQPLTIEEKKGSSVIFQEAPEKKGFRKDVKYVVTFKNKEGQVLLVKTFEVGQAEAGKGGRKRL